MRSMFFLCLMPAFAACAVEEPPVRELRSRYDLQMTLEESVCGGRQVAWGGETQGALVVDRSAFSSDADAFDLWLSFDEWGHLFKGVRVLEDGAFEGWSLYAFERDGQVIAPLFLVMEGSATQDGLVARLTAYDSDGRDNDRAVPECRDVWQIVSR